MTTQNILTKYGTTAALDFGADGAELDALAVGEICWCKPVADTTPSVSAVMIHYSIKVDSDWAAAASIEFYFGRSNGTIIDCGELGTMSDHGSNSTAATVARARANLHLAHVINADATASIVYTGNFIIDEPGPSWQLFVYNGNAAKTLDHAGSTNSVSWEEVTPDIQAAA